jgi:hypothetical protein
MVTSIITVDVNQSAFDRFNAIFKQHQASLKTMPAAWQAVAAAQAKGLKGFQALVDEQVASIGEAKMMAQVQAAASKQAETAEERAVRAARQRADAWRDIGRATKGVANDIADMTGQLLKWSSLTAVFSGLLGAGGLFGISRLAQDVAGGRQSANQLGIGYGQQKAFGTAFDRFVNPDAFLGGVTGALTNVSQRGALYNAGLTEKDLGGGAADVGVKLLQKLKTLADSTPENIIGDVFKNRNLEGLGISEAQFRGLRRYSREEINSQSSIYNKLSGSLNVNDPDQRAYQDFTTQLRAAGENLENVFVKGIAPLIPQLTRLSDAFTEMVRKILSPDSGLGDAIDVVAKAMKEFGDYIGTPEFKETVKNFTQTTATIGKYIFGNHDIVGEAATASMNAVKSFAHKYNPFTPAEDEKTRYNPTSSVFNLDKPSSVGSFNIKPGSGAIDPGLGLLIDDISKKIIGFDRVTAGQDKYHIGHRSAHNDGRAFDFTIKDPAQAAAVAEQIRGELRRLGIAGKVIDEYNDTSGPRRTAGHIHVQTDIKVTKLAGADVIVSAQQVVAPR